MKWKSVFTDSMFWGLMLVFSISALSSQAREIPSLSCGLNQEDGVHLCTDGVVDLKWSHAESRSSYELQAKSPGKDDYVTRYKGTDHSSVLSGLAEGSHSFRVRALEEDGSGVWSDELILSVEYMAAERVRLLLLIGGIVVLATIIAILHGHFTHRREEESP